MKILGKPVTSLVCGFFPVFAAAAILAACAPNVMPRPDTATRVSPREDTELVEFTSLSSLSPGRDGQIIAGPPVSLSGTLRVPHGTGPFRAVVLMHGCSGVQDVERGWEAALGEAGYATFMVNSFGGRRLSEACIDAGALLPAQRIADAYGALRALSTYPLIDGQRIALMGFSHGGIVATMSATAWAKHVFVLPDQPAFRAFIAFYPYCNWSFPEMWELFGPLRIHSGALDDWTPAKPCEQMVVRLRSAGYDAEISVYRNARHSFDDATQMPTFLPSVLNGAACAPQLVSILGPLQNPDEITACVRRGASIGGDRAATAQARTTVLSQLAELLK